MELNGSVIAGIFFLVVGASIALGYFLASALRMREYGGKLALIFACVCCHCQKFSLEMFQPADTAGK